MIDCNNCKNLNITEFEQRLLRPNKKHLCKYYNKRVIHRVSKRKHSSYLYPCTQCENDNYKNFKDRNGDV